MKEIKRLFRSVGVVVWLFTGLLSVADEFQALSACDLPTQLLHLNNWKITLPIGSGNSPTEILQPALDTYTIDPYFESNTLCNGVQFRAPVNGMTTDNTSYPRSELREMANNGTSLASWSPADGSHIMVIDEAITAIPQSKQHIVAGQIHDAIDDVIVIRLENPKLFVDINGATGPTLDSNYTLGKRFTVKFVAENNQIRVYYNGGATPAHTITRTGSGYYFKAGAYTQSNCSKESTCSSSNYGEVQIYSLSVVHQSIPPPPDTDPPSVPAGLIANTLGTTQIDLNWMASTDHTGVAGYKIYRDNGSTPIATVTGTNYLNIGLSPGTAYTYTVSAFDAVGNESVQSIFARATTLPSPGPSPGNQMTSTGFVPFKNLINPTQESMTIKYTLEGGVWGDASLIVYDLEGKEVRSLGQGTLNGNAFESVWGGQNSDGTIVSSGIYVVVLKKNGNVYTKEVGAVK